MIKSGGFFVKDYLFLIHLLWRGQLKIASNHSQLVDVSIELKLQRVVQSLRQPRFQHI